MLIGGVSQGHEEGEVSQGYEEGEISQGRQEKDFDRVPQRELNLDIQTKGYLLIGH